MKRIFLYLIKILHGLILLLSLIGPYIFNDLKILLTLIFLYICTISQWYLFNRCLLTDIETSLGNEITSYYKNGFPKSFISTYIQNKLNINEEIIKFLFTSVPIINTIVCLVKIYYLY